MGNVISSTVDPDQIQNSLDGNITLSGVALPGVLQFDVGSIPEKKEEAAETQNQIKLRSRFPEAWLWNILLIGWVGNQDSYIGNLWCTVKRKLFLNKKKASLIS